MMTIDDEGEGGVLANDDVITGTTFFGKFLEFLKNFGGVATQKKPNATANSKFGTGFFRFFFRFFSVFFGFFRFFSVFLVFPFWPILIGLTASC